MLYHEGFAFFNVIATLVFYIFYIECKQVPHTGSRDGEPTRALLLKKKKACCWRDNKEDSTQNLLKMKVTLKKKTL